MIEKNIILPFYAKASLFFIGLSALLAILYIAQSIIVPLIFAFVIAILLSPVVNLFVRIKFNRIFAIIVTLLIAIFLIAAFAAFIYTQAVSFSDSWPIFVTKFTALLNQTISSASHYFHIKPSIINDWIAKSQHELINIDTTFIGQTIVNVGSSIANLVLIPVYILTGIKICEYF